MTAKFANMTESNSTYDDSRSPQFQNMLCC